MKRRTSQNEYGHFHKHSNLYGAYRSTARPLCTTELNHLLWVLESAPAMAQADETWAEKLIPDDPR
jgi:hypothetical protein